MSEAWLQPDWPRLPGVQVRVTTRYLPGRSAAPYHTGNLGDRCGDAPDAVRANRAALSGLLDLPSEPRWLRQVHGAAVRRVDSDLPDSHRGSVWPRAQSARRSAPHSTAASAVAPLTTR